MSELLDALIEQRKQQALDYQKYLAEDRRADEEGERPGDRGDLSGRPSTLPAKRAIYDNLGKDEAACDCDRRAMRKTSKDDWRGNKFKEKEVRNAIRAASDMTTS